MSVALALLAVSSAAGLKIQPVQRRDVVVGAAAAFVPVSPAFAKSKASAAPNKPEGVGANAGQYIREQYKAEYQAMAGDKGSRGVASKEFEKNDSVQKNRDQNGGVVRRNQTFSPGLGAEASCRVSRVSARRATRMAGKSLLQIAIGIRPSWGSNSGTENDLRERTICTTNNTVEIGDHSSSRSMLRRCRRAELEIVA